MVEPELDFHKRLTRLGRKHAAMAQGYVLHQRADGLMVIRLDRPAQRRWSVLKGLGLISVGFCVFKALMLCAIGTATYDGRIAKLGQGTQIEKAGAWLMQVDPLTGLVAAALVRITG